MLTVLDLFSGIGAFSLGLERTGGFRTIAFCEIVPFCRQVLTKHWPAVPIYDDVRTVSLPVGFADVICGGFPCQDISDAGSRAGIEGSRSGLWREYVRIIGDVRPRYVIVENTEALTQRGLGRVLGDLATLGYDAEWHCIPAAAVGADHLRDRIWIVSYPNSPGSESVHVVGRKQRQKKVGKDAPQDAANDHGARLPRWLSPGKIGADARNISPRIGLAISAAPPFPGLDGAGSPVLGRGEDGIANRVDRMHAIGNAVVPQIPEIIGRAILEAERSRERSAAQP